MVGDFETTVYEGQTSTEVWASALVPIGSENVTIFHSIEETFKFLHDYAAKMKMNVRVFYHNLKFDGNFWISYFLSNPKKFHQATGVDINTDNSVKWYKDSLYKSGDFSYMISDMGQWYRIKVKTGHYFIEFVDSLKLLPFSVRALGEAFKTKHKKLDMEYAGKRYAGCEITEDEKRYIANDVLVVKEALEVMFSEGHKSMTIGSCCLKEFQSEFGPNQYDAYFPDLTRDYIDGEVYGAWSVDEYIRKSYKGGWCYLVKGKENKIYKNGVTADVNSLYPSMMHSESGNRYPVGYPTFWHGNFIPDDAKLSDRYFFIRFKCRFEIKNGFLPFVQIKGNYFYNGNDMLTTSDYIDKNGKRWEYCKRFSGKIERITVTMTMTCTDWALFNEHYNVYDLEILDGCWFYTTKGIFDEYINKYKKMKMENKGALRTLAKLFLNNLYGKTAASDESSFKVATLKETGEVQFRTIKEYEKKPGYIPVGSAITSYARNFTIRAAQKNFHGVDNPGFIYADTDSIHCDLAPEDVQGIKVDDKAFCCWKLESSWDTGVFVRQKTYIEHVVAENLEPIDQPYYNIKCAGMPERCKILFERSMTGEGIKEDDRPEIKKFLQEDESKEFLKTKRAMNDFKNGLIVPGKLLPKRIPGGVLLQSTTFEMRDRF